jgi:hypothetical protein
MTQYLVAITCQTTLTRLAWTKRWSTISTCSTRRWRLRVSGSSLAGCARRAQPDGKVLVTDGPYLETKEHIGGLSIVEAADASGVILSTYKPNGPLRTGTMGA